MRWRRNDGGESRRPQLGKTRMAASNAGIPACVAWRGDEEEEEDHGVDYGRGKIGQPAGVARVTAAPPTFGLVCFREWRWTWGRGAGGGYMPRAFSPGWSHEPGLKTL